MKIDIADNAEAWGQNLEERFQSHADDPVMMSLKSLLLKQLKHRPISPRPLTGKGSSPAESGSKGVNRPAAKTDPKRSREILQILKQVSHLFALPDHVIKITQLLNSHKATAEALSREIGRDPALAAEILKIVNSGFYGFQNQIASIQHAVVIMGFSAIHALVLSTAVVNLRSVKTLWQHSMVCAGACSLLAKQADLANSEEMGTIGLLHDIGKLVLMEYCADDYASVQAYSEREHLLFYEAEQQLLGITHAEIARWLLELWHLPTEIIEPIGQHHAPQFNSPFGAKAAAVRLADVLVRAVGIHVHNDCFIPRLEFRVLEALNIRMDDLDEVVRSLMPARLLN